MAMTPAGWEIERRERTMGEKTDDSLPVIRDVYTYLCVHDAAAALDFYTRLFGAEEVMRLTDQQGRVAHAELRLGPVLLMLVDEHPEYGIRGPLAFGGTGTTIHLHVDDVDTLTARARTAGATVLREPADYGHGERQSRLRDPFGHEWLLGHELEAVTPDEIKRRFEAEQRERVGS
ncbi:MAG TPA: VOC family protein [Gemmatimonadales bacterium]|nr:VOC family protein [Gemmatimonadales bacterium]